MKDAPDSAVAVFDDVWNTINKNYSLFQVKNVDWDSVNTAFRSAAANAVNNEELFKILSNALAVLKDGHVTIFSENAAFTYTDFYKLYPTNFNLSNIKSTYLLNEFKQKGPLLYKIVDNVGYLYYGSFYDNISDADLNEVFQELATTRGLILDVRSNTGGNLKNAEMLFSKFIDKEKLVSYEIRKTGVGHNEFSKAQAKYISAATSFYNKPVRLLTNRTCFSACNDFVMYMSYLPNVIVVGDQTGGGGAIPVEYALVNGWKLRYSSTVTLSPDNAPIENGILPDVRAEIRNIDEATGRDPILEKAYELLP